MRFMAIIKSSSEFEKEDLRPDPKLLHEMGKFNEELIKAGVVLAMDGLHPRSKGAVVKFSGESRTVVDGPFTETKELIGGYWILQVKSLEEAIEWIQRAPFHASDTEVEVRRVFEMEDFAPFLTEEEIQYKIAQRAELPNQPRNQ